jgi:hypothetical protein
VSINGHVPGVLTHVGSIYVKYDMLRSCSVGIIIFHIYIKILCQLMVLLHRVPARGNLELFRACSFRAVASALP